MGKAVFDMEESFVSSGHQAGAVICRTEHGNLHAGVIYRDRRSAAILHLGWEDQLSTSWNWARLWAVPAAAPERLNFIRSYCRRIWRQFQEKQRLPYGLTFSGSRFDASGRLLLSDDAHGLTCATFILAVFRSVGIELVDEPSWPVRSKDDLKFLELVASVPNSEPLYERIESEIERGCKRIRPDEVLGACACSTLPVRFEHARREADLVLLKLDSRKA